mmetsp:Transcript_135733/g.378153  ORF Transcript_135733/g.378153 Transcript_135733/m.378153 type:complete len:245 (-) Transcript_135733:405-1139(-)
MVTAACARAGTGIIPTPSRRKPCHHIWMTSLLFVELQQSLLVVLDINPTPIGAIPADPLVVHPVAVQFQLLNGRAPRKSERVTLRAQALTLSHHNATCVLTAHNNPYAPFAAFLVVERGLAHCLELLCGELDLIHRLGFHLSITLGYSILCFFWSPFPSKLLCGHTPHCFCETQFCRVLLHLHPACCLPLGCPSCLLCHLQGCFLFRGFHCNFFCQLFPPLGLLHGPLPHECLLLLLLFSPLFG